MNFLELCQFTHRYIKGGNDTPGTAPLDVKNQKGELYGIVRSVQDAYQDVLNDQPSWTFMQNKGTFTVPAKTQALQIEKMRASIPDLGYVVTMMGGGTRYVLLATTGSSSGGFASAPQEVTFIPYQQWRGFKDKPPIQTARPAFFTIQPDESVAFDTMTDRVYSMTFDYRRLSPKMVNNTDTPLFSEEYHSIIAWRAVLLWGGTNEANNKASFALNEYTRILNDMRSRYLPEMVFSVGQLYGSQATTS